MTTLAQTGQDTLRCQIDTIARAVCAIRGLPAPDHATLTAIALQATRALGDQRAGQPRDVARLLVEQIVAAFD